MIIEDDEVMVVGQPIIGSKMQRVREVVGKKQEQVAIDLGVTQQCISEWERSSSIKRSTLNKYAKALGVDPEAIVNFEEKAPMQFFTNCDMKSSNNGNSPNIVTIQIPTELVDTLNKMLLNWHDNMNKSK